MKQAGEEWLTTSVGRRQESWRGERDGLQKAARRSETIPTIGGRAVGQSESNYIVPRGPPAIPLVIQSGLERVIAVGEEITSIKKPRGLGGGQCVLNADEFSSLLQERYLASKPRHEQVKIFENSAVNRASDQTHT